MDASDSPPPPEPPSVRRWYWRERSPEGDLSLAWVLFLALGLPLGLMGMLTALARAGIYVEPFRPLWQPWPPEILKPFVGAAGLAATLAYLAYRIGRRSGYRSGTVAGIASARNWAEGRYTPADPTAGPATPASTETAPVPPSPTGNPPAEPQAPPPPEPTSSGERAEE